MTRNKPIPQTDSLLELLQEARQEQAKMQLSLSQLEGQTAFLRQVVMQYVGTIGEQLNVLNQNEQVLSQELQKLSSGGTQRAMAAVFYKFFRDLLNVMNQLDALVATGEVSLAKSDPEWMNSMVALQNHLEKVFKDWGCETILVTVLADHFSPEIHEAVPALEGEVPPGSPKNVIYVVRRRGWQLHGVILQYPQVVVS
jgi:molecular chaperone GrpE (heat shock protein)